MTRSNSRSAGSPAAPAASGADRRARVGPEVRETLLDLILPGTAVAGFLVAWGLAVRLFAIPPYLLPAPEDVASLLYENRGMFLQNSWITVQEVLVGFFASALIATPLAIFVVLNRTLERTLMPLLVMSQTIPKVAIAPLFVVWLGFGFLPKVAVAFLISFFPILIAAIAGLKSVETDMLDLVRSMGATTGQLVWKVRIPTALPQFFSGLKISICLSVVGAIVGEFVGSDKGLGYLLLTSAGDLNGRLTYATIVILIFIGMFLFGAVCQVEKWVIPWHVSVRVREESMWQS
jgi:NitT/TauT family transport system permease protein